MLATMRPDWPARGWPEVAREIHEAWTNSHEVVSAILANRHLRVGPAGFEVVEWAAPEAIAPTGQPGG